MLVLDLGWETGSQFWSCIMIKWGTFKKVYSLSHIPRNSDLIGLGWALALVHFLKALFRDSNIHLEAEL